MRVAVIGAGVAGLVTAKVLKQDGFDITVFERETEIGGVWASSRAYPGLRTNNPAPTYAYSDFDHAETADEFPTASQVRDYLRAYADRFGLRSTLHLGTEVVTVDRVKAPSDGRHPGFSLTTRAVGDSGRTHEHEFDFVVVCNGVLCEPNIPEFEGADGFAGSIVHSSEVPEAGDVRGKQVVVVGAGKSALDCATFASTEAESCTLVFRRPYWMLPRYFGRTRVDRKAFTRLTEMMTFPAYHAMPRAERILRWLGTPLLPLRWLYRKLQCRVIARESGIPDFMVPDSPLHLHIYHQGIGAEFYDKLRHGRVRAKRAVIDRFEGSGRILLSSGDRVETDLVICATGWRQNIEFLNPGLRRLVRPDRCFRLYRHILPPAEQRLAFNGYASSGNSPLTSEVAAHWISQCFRDQLPLPEIEDMERNIDQVLDWTAETFPEQDQGHFIGAHVPHYIDWLMRDMGLATKRADSLGEEYLGPFWAKRYRGLAADLRRT